MPLKDSVPRAPAKVAVPPTTRARPENDTRSPPPLAQACALRALSFSVPRPPRRVALPLNVMQVELVNVPLPEPLSVPLPMGRPRPFMDALPAAVSPLTCPEAVPEYEAENERVRAAPA
ncbi:MAG TPA: hypothetical protein VJ814_08575 [Gaiellaceae bacterium]|nr:hypothetical protein [Gaiellaceae bacterium]